MRAVPLALALALALAPSAQAPAQISADQVRQRYDKQTKGAGVEEWARKMNSDDPLERLEGVKSLSTATDPAAVPYLVQALGDTDVRVKAKAIDACGTARAADATPVLVQMLFLRGTSPEVEQRILAALGKIGDQRTSPQVIEFLGRDLDPATRGTALYALGDIAAPDSADFLDKFAGAEPNPTLKRIAREAAAKVRYQQALRNTEAKQPLDTFLKKDEPPPR